MSTPVLEDATEAAKAALAEGVRAAYAQEGYVDNDGDRDEGAVQEAAYAAVAPAVVGAKSQREAVAITKGDLVAAVFPSLPKRAEEWNTLADPGLASKVYSDIKSLVWGYVKRDKSGKVQQLVGLRLPGFVLCQTKVGNDQIDAAYVTDDVGCITEDFVAPLNASVVRSHRTMGRNVAMVVDRKPETATKWERLYMTASKSGLVAGHDPIKLAMEAARDNGAAPSDDAAE